MIPGIIGSKIAGSGPKKRDYIGEAETEDKNNFGALRNRYAGLQKQFGTYQNSTPLVKEDDKLTGPLPEYDLARQKAQQQAQKQGATNEQALQRRFAAMGGGPGSGVLLKQQEMNDQHTQDSIASANSDIGSQEASARRGLQQAALQRNMQREFYNADQAFKDKVNSFDTGSKLFSLGMAIDESERDARTTLLNARTAKYQQAHSGGLFGGGGFLGLGIGNDESGAL